MGIGRRFVDCGESPEKALKRECQEEVGITIDTPSYLACYPNTYTYKSIAYPVLDLFFTAKECSPAESLVCDREEVSHVEWQIHGVLIRLSSPSFHAACTDPVAEGQPKSAPLKSTL